MIESARISQLAGILQKYNICGDVSPIYNALGKLNTTNQFVLEELRMDFDAAPRNTRPILNLIYVELWMNIPNDDFLDRNKWENYSFKMKIIGTDNAFIDHIASWHLDFDNSGSACMVHPYYHLTYGGQSMDNIDLGETALFPVPRIAYPPMDIFIGIDFILQNFLPKNQYNKIREDTNYQCGLQKAQQWLWKPYLSSILSNILNKDFGVDQNESDKLKALSTAFCPSLY